MSDTTSVTLLAEFYFPEKFFGSMLPALFTLKKKHFQVRERGELHVCHPKYPNRTQK